VTIENMRVDRTGVSISASLTL